MVLNSTFAGNYALRGHFGGGGSHDGRASGGAIFLVAGSLSVNNSTFSSNTTDGVGGLGGGAIAVYQGALDLGAPRSSTWRFSRSATRFSPATASTSATCGTVRRPRASAT